jgi:hypothetical protein
LSACGTTLSAPVKTANPAKQILPSDLDKVRAACPDSLPAPAARPKTLEEILEFEVSVVHRAYFNCAEQARGIIQQVEKVQEVE